MARNRDEQFRQYQLVQRCLHGDAQARDLLYDLLYRYLHDKLAAYLKKQCPYLSGDDFEDVISLTLAKCLEDLPLFQNRSCLTTWAFRYGIHFAQNTNRKTALTTAIISIWTHLALCIKPVWIRWLYISKRSCQKSFSVPVRYSPPDSYLGSVPKPFFYTDCPHYASQTGADPAALSFCLHDDAAKFSLLLLPSSFCICPAEKIQPMKG